MSVDDTISGLVSRPNRINSCSIPGLMRMRATVPYMVLLL